MDELDLDTELHRTLESIRESVRQLFEQLRLRGSEGDITAKDRLERVPAFAKRNFANLAEPNARVAIKEAWRLIDFLEGSDQARLSPRAREGLRVIELDQQLATLRASKRWKEAAVRLREAIGATLSGSPATAPTASTAPEIESAVATQKSADEPEAEHLLENTGVASRSATLTGRLRRPGPGWLLGLAILGAAAILAGIWRSEVAVDPRQACVAIEDASESALARHWSGGLGRPLPRPPHRADEESHQFPISDPPGGPVQSTWTTSKYSYAERTTRAGPGGGMSDFRLRVGGWGDTYLSLLQVPIPTNHLVQRAVIRLTVMGDVPDSRPTSMTLRGIMESWRVDPGPNNRMWWRDCPPSYAIRTHLPPPGPPESTYEIDITDLYNLWARGERIPNGIILEPEHIGQWGERLPHYSNFSTFYSTRAADPDNRPRLVLTY